jgi:hypothetical protein
MSSGEEKRETESKENGMLRRRKECERENGIFQNGNKNERMELQCV